MNLTTRVVGDGGGDGATAAVAERLRGWLLWEWMVMWWLKYTPLIYYCYYHHDSQHNKATVVGGKLNTQQTTKYKMLAVGKLDGIEIFEDTLSILFLGSSSRIKYFSYLLPPPIKYHITTTITVLIITSTLSSSHQSPHFVSCLPFSQFSCPSKTLSLQSCTIHYIIHSLLNTSPATHLILVQLYFQSSWF